ncbi:MAG TPA: glycosyltransferase family 39 protein, partial [Isosphaeraceae bacterium]|nr:glycosyltransferase family 39 protein [Isosphaeraceae bacterium]
EAFDLDEGGYLETIAAYRFPMHHTLFLAAARVVSALVGEPYRGFVVLDMLTSALALWATWWWLRGLVGRRTALAGTLVLAAAPVFWAYGAMAANYTAIPIVGSLLLGLAWRGHDQPRPWHPFAAAIALALGAGYRQDIGTFWFPAFLVILWQHRWIVAAQALLVCGIVNFAWLLPMLHDVGGWSAYREASAEFAYKAGYLNSVWNVGLVDAPLRYAVKGLIALVWTLGPAIIFAFRGAWRLPRMRAGRFLALLLALSVVPALASHLLVHFGVPGYVLHYVPALVALVALGIGPAKCVEAQPCSEEVVDRKAALRLASLAAILAAVFLAYPTNYNRAGLWGDFDLAFGRQTRIGLRTRPPMRDPGAWRTVNSQELPGATVRRARTPHRSVLDVLGN